MFAHGAFNHIKGKSMLIVALTGGIATGKSIVARMFTELGAHIIDYDKLSREVVEPHEPAWEDIVEWFGADITQPDGSLNRAKLGSIVFADAGQRKKLESFIHPRILRKQQAMLRDIEQYDPSAIVIVDVPLLFEVKLDARFSRIILVYAPPDIQLERLKKRDGFTAEEARSRIAAQLPIDEKVDRSHFVVHNEGAPEDTEKQVKSIFLKLRELEKSGA